MYSSIVLTRNYFYTQNNLVLVLLASKTCQLFFCYFVVHVGRAYITHFYLSLPIPLRDMNSIYSLRKQLKTYLFSGGCRA